MKNIIVFFSCLLLVFTSCEECVPTLTSLPDDVVPETCISDGFFASRMSLNIEGNPEWYFDQLPESDINLSITTNLDNLSGTILDFPFLANAAAYDEINDRYAFSYYYDFQDGTFGTRHLYLSETATNQNTIYTIDESYVAPVFLNGILYAFSTFISPGVPELGYQIRQVDLANGSSAVIYSGLIPSQPFFNEWISSTSNGQDRLFFAAGDQVIAYNISTNSATVNTLDEDNNPNSFLNIYGLEYQPDQSRLVATTLSRNQADFSYKIVGIAEQDLSTSIPLLDLEYLGPFVGEFSFSFYATTFDVCSNKYFLTLPAPGFSFPYPEATNVSIIDLEANAQSNISADHFFFGVEFTTE